jgi:hypothetical protein
MFILSMVGIDFILGKVIFMITKNQYEGMSIPDNNYNKHRNLLGLVYTVGVVGTLLGGAFLAFKPEYLPEVMLAGMVIIPLLHLVVHHVDRYFYKPVDTDSSAAMFLKIMEKIEKIAHEHQEHQQQVSRIVNSN